MMVTETLSVEQRTRVVRVLLPGGWRRADDGLWLDSVALGAYSFTDEGQTIIVDGRHIFAVALERG